MERYRIALSIKNKSNFTYICIGVVVLLIVVALVVDGISSLTSRKADTSEGLKIIMQAESAEVTTIENKIQALEEKEASEDSRSLKEVFSSAVVMGDSITDGFAEYDVLNASSVVAEIGVGLDELDEQIDRVKELNPQVAFLSYGLNDILMTKGDTELFVEEYKAVLNKMKKELPDTKIFVNSIFPVQQKVTEAEPDYKKLDEYNQALQEMCDKVQIAYVDNSKIVADRYYEDDGIHFKSAFYQIWAERMAEVASL